MQHGYQLETDSLGGDPILGRFKENETIRPARATDGKVSGNDPMRQRDAGFAAAAFEGMGRETGELLHAMLHTPVV